MDMSLPGTIQSRQILLLIHLAEDILWLRSESVVCHFGDTLTTHDPSFPLGSRHLLWSHRRPRPPTEHSPKITPELLLNSDLDRKGMRNLERAFCPSRRTVGMGLIYDVPIYFAQMFSHFCQLPINTSVTRLRVEQSVIPSSQVPTSTSLTENLLTEPWAPYLNLFIS